MPDTTVGILLAMRPTADGRPPTATAFGQAIQTLAAEGIEVILATQARAGVAHGIGVADGQWRPTRARCDAWVHRFPQADRPDAWEALRAQLGGRPVCNPPDLLTWCTDKWSSQRDLVDAGVPMPECIVDPDGFRSALRRWGGGFIKPRYGSFGRGVQFVSSAADLPSEGAWILQRAVSRPTHAAGICVRVLVQRQVDGHWTILPGAARIGTEDPVVNHARGARVVPDADLLTPAALRTSHQIAHRVTSHVSEQFGPHAIELGLDFAIDADGQPHLIEVNGKPRGRLAALAEQEPGRFSTAHARAIAGPLRTAAALGAATASA